MMRKFFVGTSGWMYKHWGERFYPKDLKKNFLQYYANEFKTVEINSSFYHMPTAKTFRSWNEATPKNFIFSIKLNRYITHRKKLILDEESTPFLSAFLKNSQNLEKKFSVVLIQLPPSFKKNNDRLRDFCKTYSKQIKALKYKPLTTIEFRHESWDDEETFDILRKNKIAMTLTSTPHLMIEVFTANFVYIRMHGDAAHSSNYKNKELMEIKKRIDAYPKEIKKIFIYFNNDYSAYAIDNARFMISLFNKEC